MRQTKVPDKYRGYPCKDYFDEGWSARGHFDEASQTLVIAPIPEAYLDWKIEFFAVGRSGLGGIDFGYRKGQPGLWAYYPIERKFKYTAATIAELVDGWYSSRLSL